MNKQRLNDFKSIMFYNQSNLASMMGETMPLQEIDNRYVIKLPISKSKRKTEPFLNILKSRKSTRSFIKHPLDLDTFSTVVHYSFGISQRKINYEGIKTTTRYYPSGGGLYPINIYFYINNVSTLNKGFFLYQPYSHSLLPIKSDIKAKDLFVGDALDFENMCFAVFYEYSINKNFLKYGELALLTSLVEVGTMSENFDLVSTAFYLDTCAVAGFNKTIIENAIHQDGVNSHIVFSSICG
ncbi:SagB family peptide dehydrogenase, partial [Listeria valentina]|uniref:SagB family peptide dehydrogenase n=1 Tax=Listeria valentina TaxID=2705293 RepID=UPI001AD92B1A